MTRVRFGLLSAALGLCPLFMAAAPRDDWKQLPQAPHVRPYFQGVVVQRPLGYHPWGWGGGYGYGWGGGTAAGNQMMGAAAMIRAQGETNEANSRARINNEVARSKYIENRQAWTKAYFEMKQQNQAYVDEKAQRDREIRDRFLESQQQSSAATRPGFTDLDPTTGAIRWPQALLDDQYAPGRKHVEELFQLRTQSSGSTELANELRSSIDELRSQLKANIRGMSANDYVPARRFLDNLSREAGFPAV